MYYTCPSYKIEFNQIKELANLLYTAKDTLVTAKTTNMNTILKIWGITLLVGEVMYTLMIVSIIVIHSRLKSISH